MSQLDDIEARLNAATPGPWFREYGDVITSNPDPRDTEEGYDYPRHARVVRAAPHLPKKDRQSIADAEFIASAPTDIRDLLTLARKQAAQIESVRVIANDLSVEAHRLYAAANNEMSPEFQHRARSRAQYLEGTSLDLRARLEPMP